MNKSTIRQTTDKNNKPVSYIYSGSAMRWIRISKDTVNSMREAGKISEICHGEQPLSRGVKCVEQWTDADGVSNSRWMIAA